MANMIEQSLLCKVLDAPDLEILHSNGVIEEILIFNYKQSAESVKDLIAYQKKVLRHEIVHAFLYESGLWQNAYGSKCWAKNEEMIDWMAI